MTTITPRLPGITFQAVPPPPESDLPRMDIAGFVGLASSGPLHVPIPIEDPLTFRAIFGPDVELAWDAERGDIRYSMLGPAVEAFFRNGGRRCWVVRVADQTQAQTNAFPVEGLVSPNTHRPAYMYARCPGSWSDGLRAGTMLDPIMLSFVSFEKSEDSRRFTLSVSDNTERLRRDGGDLISVFMKLPEEPEGVAQDSLRLFLMTSRTEVAQTGLKVESKEAYWFYTKRPQAETGEAVAVTCVTPDNEDRSYTVDTSSPEDHSIAVHLNTTFDNAPRPGDLLLIDYGTRLRLLPVRESYVKRVDSASAPYVVAHGTEEFWTLRPEEEEQAWAGLENGLGSPIVTLLTFQLLVWDGQNQAARIRELGFHKSHPRFWAKLPNDEELFELPIDKPRLTNVLAGEAMGPPRYPLAGSRPVYDESGEAAATETSPLNLPALEELYLPLGMPHRPTHALAQGPISPTDVQSRLVRDGLKEFTSALFLDKRFPAMSFANLLTELEHRYYVQQEKLHGIYSLFPVDEISLLAIPDAIHPTWQLESRDAAPVLEAPVLDEIDEGTRKPDSPNYTVTWSTVDCVNDPEYETVSSSDNNPPCTIEYQLQQSLHPSFQIATTLHFGIEAQYKDRTSDACADLQYFRVRAIQNDDQVSPWSATRSALLPPKDFIPRDLIVLDAPSLNLDEAETSSQEVILNWSEVEGQDLPETTDGGETLQIRYQIEEAFDPEMSSPKLYTPEGTGTSIVIPRQQGLALYYRVRVTLGTIVGPWSNTVFCLPDPITTNRLTSEAKFKDRNLLEVQLAMLRFCAARADMMALFSLPRHYETRQVLRHRSILRYGAPDDESGIKVNWLDTDEHTALSYAALYHPWLYTRQVGHGDNSRISTLPPESAVAGTYARRTLQRGAWIAPANEPMRDVVGLEQHFSESEWSTLFPTQINIVHRDPRGYMTLSAETLSHERAWQPVGTRRLLILLRRLALQEGEKYVFQNNSRAFHRLVQQQFSKLLESLYMRGAFAGRTLQDSYQVRVDGSLNSRQQMDQGRFYVELRVAPSQPATFITVRLVQSGAAGLRIEEI